MADNFGLKIGIEGEKEFKRALSDINQSFKVLGSEMKLVESEFGKNENSVQSLTAKNEVLTKQIDAQKDKIETLQKALKNASDSFGENDRRTQNWALQLNNAKAELNGMDRELAQSADEADKLGDELEDVGDAANNSGVKFGKLGGILKGVGVAMGTVAVAAGAAAFKLGKEVVQQFGELEQNLGGSEAVFGKYASSIQKTGEDAYKKLGVSQSDYLATANKMGALFQGSGVEQQKSLELTEKAMQRAADAASVMGIDMQMALDSVAGAAKGNFTMMDNLGVAMNDTTLKAYALEKGVNFEWSTATQAQKAELAMQMFFEKTEQYAGNFEKEATQSISGSIGLLSASWESLLAGFGNPDADIDNLTKNLTDAIKAVVTNITPVINNLVQSVPQVFDALIPAISGLLPQLLTTVASLFDSLLIAIIELLPTLIPVAVDAIMMITETLIENLPLIISAAMTLITSLAQGIADSLPTLMPTIVDTVLMIVDTLINNVDLLVEAAIAIIVGLTTGLIDALPHLIAKAPEIIASLLSAILKAVPKLLTAGVKIVTTIVSGLASLPGKMLSIGGNLISGLWEGIGNKLTWLKNKLSDFANSVISGIKDFFGVHSPSTVFAGIGGFLSEGLADGISSKAGLVSKAMHHINDDLQATANISVSGGGSGTLTYMHSGTIRVEGINDEKQLVSVTEIIMNQLRKEGRR
jgi:hypothetical protein